MKSNLLGSGCGDRRDECTVADGVMEYGIAEIAVFLRAVGLRSQTRRAALVERQRRQLKSGVHGGSRMMTSRWRYFRGIFAKVEFVKICVEYLYESGYDGTRVVFSRIG